MRKQYSINLNPEENPDIGYLNMGLLGNPFPRTAICMGPLADPDPKFSQMAYELSIERHLKAGCTPEQARRLLHGLLTEEAIDLALDGATLGDRLDVIVDSDEMKMYKRKLPAPELQPTH
jgi:hypothetical protein